MTPLSVVQHRKFLPHPPSHICIPSPTPMLFSITTLCVAVIAMSTIYIYRLYPHWSVKFNYEQFRGQRPYLPAHCWVPSASCSPRPQSEPRPDEKPTSEPYLTLCWYLGGIFLNVCVSLCVFIVSCFSLDKTLLSEFIFLVSPDKPGR